jgi:hypothetical protein
VKRIQYGREARLRGNTKREAHSLLDGSAILECTVLEYCTYGRSGTGTGANAAGKRAMQAQARARADREYGSKAETRVPVNSSILLCYCMKQDTEKPDVGKKSEAH